MVTSYKNPYRTPPQFSGPPKCDGEQSLDDEEILISYNMSGKELRLKNQLKDLEKALTERNKTIKVLREQNQALKNIIRCEKILQSLNNYDGENNATV